MSKVINRIFLIPVLGVLFLYLECAVASVGCESEASLNVAGYDVNSCESGLAAMSVCVDTGFASGSCQTYKTYCLTSCKNDEYGSRSVDNNGNVSYSCQKCPTGFNTPNPKFWAYGILPTGNRICAGGPAECMITLKPGEMYDKTAGKIINCPKGKYCRGGIFTYGSNTTWLGETYENYEAAVKDCPEGFRGGSGPYGIVGL